MDEFRAIYKLSEEKYPISFDYFLGLVSLPKDEEKKEHREVKNTMQKLKKYPPCFLAKRGCRNAVE
jgi:hypothetical protein